MTTGASKNCSPARSIEDPTRHPRRALGDDITLSGARALTFFAEAGYELLSVSAGHAAAVERLPRLHADPFDRLLVAQALSEPLRLLTHDKTLAAYSDTVIQF